MTKRKKILVVDDDVVVRKALSIKLTGQGYEVLTASDGSEAVGIVRQKQPDLILLDISFPTDVGGVHWDGFLIMEWLKRLEEAGKIPIIIITGGDPAKVDLKAKASGAVAFFHKPVDHEELFAVIEKTLDENWAES